ncbi:hypothetical protein SLEP1_g38166 [Rubroshorea leprosula]|uniref:DUF4219 domain-containing protein n=1 Tax=Rubroshorea leprosula TaxID=152421 RepID=A0AAV5KXB7_9ROSI|nr:hypothetical protein SLEP1_g38166 [Rubroshorea leprosula]
MTTNKTTTGSLSNRPLFTGQNYNIWAIKMKAFLRGNDVWDSVENGFNPLRLPNNPTVAQLEQHVDYVQASYKAISFIHSSVADFVFLRIMRVETAKSTWDTLQKEFEVDSKVKDNLLTLKRQFEMLTMKETETVHQYSNKLIDIVNQIRFQVEDFPDKRVVDKIMLSVLDKFELTISAIEESCDLNQLTISELTSKVCQCCQLEKMHQLSFPVSKAFRASEKLSLTVQTFVILGIYMASNKIRGDRGHRLFFTILGAVLFILGFYHTRIAYYAYKGYKGFSFSNIPPV